MVETVKTYAARRRLKIGTEFRSGPQFKGDPITVAHLVPEAHLWFRQESLLHTGQMQLVTVSIEDLFEAFELRGLSSADCLAILARLGLKDGVEVMGTHKSPRAPGPKSARKAAQQLAPDRKTGPGTHRKRATPVAAEKAPVAKKAPVKKVAVKKVAAKTRAKRSTTATTKGAGTAVLIPLREGDE